MIENFNNIYLFLLFIFACIFTPGFYAAAQLWESKKVLERYGIDESATLIARFAACWPTAEALVALLILFIGPQGNLVHFSRLVLLFSVPAQFTILCHISI